MAPWKPWFLTKTCFDVLKFSPVIMGFAAVGYWLDKRNDRSMSDFHNKSALFGGKQLAPGERVW